MNGMVTPDKKAVGARLERLRVVFGFKTKTAFAEWLGIGEDTYRHYVAGRNRVSDHVCTFLKEQRGVTSDWLRHGDTAGLSQTLFDQIFPAAAPSKTRKQA